MAEEERELKTYCFLIDRTTIRIEADRYTKNETAWSLYKGEELVAEISGGYKAWWIGKPSFDINELIWKLSERQHEAP